MVRIGLQPRTRYPAVGEPVRIVREVTTTIRNAGVPNDEPSENSDDNSKKEPGDKAKEKPGEKPQPKVNEEIVTTIQIHEEYAETILEMAAGRPKIYRRVYDRCRMIFNEDVEEASYSGLTLLFERTKEGEGAAAEEKVQITVESGSKPENKGLTPEQPAALLPDADRQVLEHEAKAAGEWLDLLPLPNDPIAAGESWQFQPNAQPDVARETIIPSINGQHHYRTEHADSSG